MRLLWEPEAQQLAGEGKGRIVSPRVGGLWGGDWANPSGGMQWRPCGALGLGVAAHWTIWSSLIC